MGNFLATWHRAISTATIAKEFAPPRPASWPDALTHGQLAALQYPYNTTETDKHGFAGLRARYILDCCKSGELPCTLTTTTKAAPPLRQPKLSESALLGWGSFKSTPPPPPQRPQPVAVPTYTVTAPAFAAWLAAQDEKPSAHIAAWFEAAGVNHQSEAATDETPEARNDRWLAFYEAEEKAGRKHGAYERGSNHFNVERSTYNKAVKKAIEKRAEQYRAGMKAVPVKARGWGAQLVIDGKKTKGTKA
jgi:hypothetical protein